MGGVETFALEDVTEVAVALFTDNFDALGAEAGVAAELDGVARGRVVEGRPPAVGVELGGGGEKGGAATGADVGAGALLLEDGVGGGEGAVGTGLAEDAVLLGGEAGAPCGVGKLGEVGHAVMVSREQPSASGVSQLGRAMTPG